MLPLLSPPPGRLGGPGAGLMPDPCLRGKAHWRGPVGLGLLGPRPGVDFARTAGPCAAVETVPLPCSPEGLPSREHALPRPPPEHAAGRGPAPVRPAGRAGPALAPLGGAGR